MNLYTVSFFFGMNFAVLGVVWVMTVKPDWAGAAGIPVVLAIIGALVGTSFRGARRPATEPRAIAHEGRR